jgi:hypothetical protein
MTIQQKFPECVFDILVVIFVIFEEKEFIDKLLLKKCEDSPNILTSRHQVEKQFTLEIVVLAELSQH